MSKYNLRQRVRLFTRTQRICLFTITRLKYPLQDQNTPGYMQDKTLKWSLVLCLPAKSRQLREKYKAGAGPSFPTSTLSTSSLDRGALSACKPVPSSYFSISPVPRKYTWPLLTVIPQSIPHYTVPKYSVCPHFKTFKLDYVFPGANAYSLMPAARLPSDWWQQPPAHLPDLPWRKALFSLHKSTQCLRCQLPGSHLSARVTMHTWSNEGRVKAGPSHAD